MKISINKTLFVLAAATTVSMASSASFAETPKSMKTETRTESDLNGNYKKTTTVSGKDSNGTKTSDTNEVKVKVNKDGSYTKSTETNSSKDPKGLFNKSEVKSSNSVNSKDDNYEDKRSIETKNGVTGTKTSNEASEEIKTDSDGNVIKTVETEVSKDPKGMMNKSSVKTSDEVSTDKAGRKYNYTKEVNGKTVKEENYKSN
jgi:hypothetical protein